MWFLTLVIGLVVGYLFRDRIKPVIDKLFGKSSGGCCSG